MDDLLFFQTNGDSHSWKALFDLHLLPNVKRYAYKDISYNNEMQK